MLEPLAFSLQTIAAVIDWIDVDSAQMGARAIQCWTEVIRGTSWHRFLGCRNEFPRRLEMDRGKRQDGLGRRLRHQARCDPSGPNLYRCGGRLGRIDEIRIARHRERRVIAVPLSPLPVHYRAPLYPYLVPRPP